MVEPDWARARAQMVASQLERRGVREPRVLEKIRLYMDNGATGVMFGRNMWLRRPAEALVLTRKVHGLLARYSR